MPAIYGPKTAGAWGAATSLVVGADARIYRLTGTVPQLSVASAAGNYTVGVRFHVSDPGISCTGARVYWAVSSTKNVKVCLWDAANTLLATVTVAVAATGVVEAVFGTPQTLTAGAAYRISCYQTDGANLSRATSASAVGVVPARPFEAGQSLTIQDASLYAAGDAHPAGVSGTDLYLIDPVFAFPLSASAPVVLAPFASRPAPTPAGTSFIASDGGPLWIATGALWRPVINGELGYQPPAAASFTQINFGGSTTFVDEKGSLYLADLTAAADTARIVVVAKPSGNYTFRACLLFSSAWADNATAGIVITDGTGTPKCITFGPLYSSSPEAIQIVRRNSPSSWNANVVNGQLIARPLSTRMYFTVTNDGTNRRWYLSADPFHTGRHILTEAVGTFLTETHIGLFVNAIGAPQASVRCLSWEATSP